MRRPGAVRIAVIVLAAAVVFETAALVFVAGRESARLAAADRPVQRGRRVAEAMGCFGCHGSEGGRPIPNPGARGGEVPSWSGGTWRMYSKSEADLRAWVLDGHPAGRERDPDALIQMPAYRRLVSGRDLEDLVAYLLAVQQFGDPPDDKVGAGLEAATKYGCFGCHGSEGRGLIENPRSFRGFVPPWDGPDYPELVRDRAEFEEWVRDGVTERFRRNPGAQAFLTRQAVAMPAFGNRVSPEELDALFAYVAWVRAHPRGPA